MARVDRRAIVVFYVLACIWSWPFFWWQDAHAASWNAWRLRTELKEPFIQWGPGLAAFVVYGLFPRTRSQFLSLAGSSWNRSLICFLVPIVTLCTVAAFRGDPRWASGPYYLIVVGFSCLGEEVADSAQASVYSEDHTRSSVDRAVDAYQDDCPCHMQFSAVELVSHEAIYRVNLAPAITPLFYTPLFPFNLLRPPLGN